MLLTAWHRSLSSKDCSTSTRICDCATASCGFLKCTWIRRLHVAAAAKQAFSVQVVSPSVGSQAKASDFLNVNKQPHRPSLYHNGGKTTFVSIPFTLTQLTVLKAVVTTENFDEAAQLMATSGANLRTVLSTLEKAVGMTLVQKSHEKGDGPRKRLALTPAGALLLHHGNKVLSISYDLLMALKDFNSDNKGTLHIGASQTSGVYVMPKLIETFKRKHAKVSVHLQVENTATCCRAVASGQLELALVGGQIPQNVQQAVEVRPFREEDIVLIVSPGHALSKHKEIHKKQLAKLKFVSLSQSSTLIGVKSILESKGIQWQDWQVVMEVNSFEAIKSAVKVNLGAAFVPRQCVEEDILNGSLVGITITGVPLSRTLSIVTPRGRYTSRAVQEFLAMLAPSTDGNGKTQQWSNTVDGVSKGSPDTSGPDSFLPFSQRLERLCPITLIKGNLTDRLPSPLSKSSSPSSRSLSPSLPTSPTFTAKFPFTIAQLAAFHCVAHSGSTKAASLVLSVSQPNVSKLLTTLEASLGMQLITKHSSMAITSRCQVTEGGQLLLQYADGIMEMAAEMSRGLEELRGRGVVRVGGSDSTATYLITRWIGGFRQANPTVKVQLMVDSTARILQAVAEGKLDIAVVEEEVPLTMKAALQVTEYATDALLLVCGREHPLAARGCLDLSDLPQLSLLALSEGTAGHLQHQTQQLLHTNNVDWAHLSVEMEFTSLESLKLAVQHGVGVAFIPSIAVQQELELGLLMQLPVRGLHAARTLHLVSNSQYRRSPAAAKFVQQMFGFGHSRSLHAVAIGPPSTPPWHTANSQTTE